MNKKQIESRSPRTRRSRGSQRGGLSWKRQIKYVLRDREILAEIGRRLREEKLTATKEARIG